MLREINYRLNNAARKSKIIIQTFHPDHLVWRALQEPERFYRTELNARRRLGYPPYRYLARYFYGDMSPEKAKKEAEKLRHVLEKQLTEAKKDAILTALVEMQPRYYRGRYWQAIIIKLNVKTWQEDLVWLNQFVPGNWKIDPNPISLLSP